MGPLALFMGCGEVERHLEMTQPKKKNGPFPAPFFFIFVFSIQLTVTLFNINFADGWIRAAELWCCKRPLYQLSHNHCPSFKVLLAGISGCDLYATSPQRKHVDGVELAF